MGEEKLVSEENARAAAYYGIRAIQTYVNDIRAAAPHAPEVFGGGTYIYFLYHLKNIEKILNGEEVQDVINRMGDEDNNE